MRKRKEDLLQEVGQRIRDVRLAADIPQKQLADEFESEQSRISKIEKGAREPGTDFYYWFAERTGRSLDYLICGKESDSGLSDYTISKNAKIKDAVKLLVNSILDSYDIEKHLEQKLDSNRPRTMNVDLADGKTVTLTESETDLFSEIRSLPFEDVTEIIKYFLQYIKDHKN